MDDDLIKIETKIAYLENALLDLQNAEESNRKKIEILEAENRIFKIKIKELLENAEIEIPSRKPPHY